MTNPYADGYGATYPEYGQWEETPRRAHWFRHFRGQVWRRKKYVGYTGEFDGYDYHTAESMAMLVLQKEFGP